MKPAYPPKIRLKPSLFRGKWHTKQRFIDMTLGASLKNPENV